VSPSGSLTIDALARGVKWGDAPGTGVTVTYSFPWVSGPAVFSGLNGSGSYSTVNEPAGSYAFNATQRQAARDALQTWAAVADIEFVEVADTATNVGDIRFTWTAATMGTASAWGRRLTSPGQPDDGDVWFSTAGASFTDPNWSVGSINYMRLIHEIGHVLGFKHPGNYDSGGSLPPPPFLPADLDTRQYTIMSYNDPPKELFRTLTHNPDGSVQRHYFEVKPETPMVLDIAALQYLYGANTHYRTGNDVYSFDPARPFLKTLWDAGGDDTITVSNFTEPCRIDLAPGGYSTIRIVSEPLPAGSTGGTTPTYDGTNNLGIAYGTMIENAIGGGGNDMLIGNGAANRLFGGPGNDTLDGGGGTDTAGYGGARAGYTVGAGGAGVSGPDGQDALTGIERIVFSDRGLAFDLGPNGAGGNTVKIIGVAHGAAAIQQHPEWVGIGLELFDGGASVLEVCGLVAQALGLGNTNFVIRLYTNVAGTAPSVPERAAFVALLAGSGGTMTQAQLLELAANHPLNELNINLVGLQETGAAFI
jgi:hypothetical protein